MKKFNYKTIIFTALSTSLLLFLSISSRLHSDNHTDIYFCPKTQEKLDEKQNIQRLETYLQRNVPGLPITYCTVIDSIIAEGFDVYLKGGILRDLFSCPPEEPNDVDFTFSGSVDDIRAIFQKHGWTYFHKPGKPKITIGNDETHYMDGVPLKDFDIHDVNALEFTVNNIFYHCNTKSFVNSSKLAIQDAVMKQLKVLSNDWEMWLFGDHDHSYYKIFRFWKMIGKGYHSSPKFTQFMQEKTFEVIKKDKINFGNELLNYLAGHFKNFDTIANGCSEIMTDAWSNKNVYPLRPHAMMKYVKKKENRKKHIYRDKDKLTADKSS